MDWRKQVRFFVVGVAIVLGVTLLLAGRQRMRAGVMLLPERVLRCDALKDLLPTQREVEGVTGLYLRGYAAQHVLALTPAKGTRHLCVMACDLEVMPTHYCLPSLEYVWLSSNMISQVPEEITACRALTYLNLDRNRLTTLPSLKAVPLRWLRVNENRLQALPELPETLERLYAANNCLTQVSKLPSHVREVELSYNPLEALPDDFGVGLERLDVAYTSLKKFPADLSGWRTLRVLNVAGCPLSEEEKDRLEAAFDLDKTTIIF
jgi:Leucine-rich repeat (LRR) protein